MSTDYVFQVTLDIPYGATPTQVKDYIRDAVASWKGCLDPESAIFDLDGDSVNVKCLKVDSE